MHPVGSAVPSGRTTNEALRTGHTQAQLGRQLKCRLHFDLGRCASAQSEQIVPLHAKPHVRRGACLLGGEGRLA